MRDHPLQTVETPDVPLGARKLGCRNCLTVTRASRPELGLIYCATCPVTLRRQARREGPTTGPTEAEPQYPRA